MGPETAPHRSAYGDPHDGAYIEPPDAPARSDEFLTGLASRTSPRRRSEALIGVAVAQRGSDSVAPVWVSRLSPRISCRFLNIY